MSRHSDRIDGIVAAFEKSHDRFVRELEAVDDAAVGRAPPSGGWTPAQIGWHVGVTNEMLSAIVTGESPTAKLAPEDFREQAWSAFTVPAKIETMPPLQPPAQISRGDALERLDSGASRLVEALRTLSSDRASGYIVKLPFGTLSMYQVGEFAAFHIDRHAAQVQRTLREQPAGSSG